LADDSSDLSRLPKFGNQKARSGRAAGEFARVCPDRASSLTGPRIVRTLTVSLRENSTAIGYSCIASHTPAPIELTNGD